jgi:hypothetical protein
MKSMGSFSPGLPLQLARVVKEEFGNETEDV